MGVLEWVYILCDKTGYNVWCVIKPTTLNTNCDVVSTGVQQETSEQVNVNCRHRGMSAWILGVSTGCRKMSIFMPKLIHPGGNSPWYPATEMLPENRYQIYLNTRQLSFIISNFQENSDTECFSRWPPPTPPQFFKSWIRKKFSSYVWVKMLTEDLFCFKDDSSLLGCEALPGKWFPTNETNMSNSPLWVLGP